MKKPNMKGVTFKQPVLATELRFAGSNERAVGANGELNAGSTRELLANIQRLITASAEQPVLTESEATRRAEKAKVHQQMITAAFSSNEAHKELGATLADELYISANREGFMRRFLARQELSQGQRPYVKMRLKNVVATVAGAPTKTFSQIIRDNMYFPPEFYINSRPFIEEREIQQSIADVLEEKFVEAQEGIMVAEDRIYYRMATNTAGISNDFTTIIGTMNPSALVALKTLVTRWNIPASSFLIATDIWGDIVGDAQFAAIIDPVSKHELLLTGQLGTILGMTVYTDAFRHPQHKVLNQGEMFVIGDAVNHGIYTDRGGVSSTPIDGSIEQVPGKGWWMSELISMVIANSRSVAKARRI